MARADAILHPGGLAARRAQAQGVARSLHRRCPLLHAATQERPTPGIAPRVDPARRSGDLRRGQALSRDAGRPARHRDGLGRGSPVAHPSPDRQPRGRFAGERRGRGQDRVSGLPLAPGDRSSAPLRLPRGFAAQGGGRVEGEEAHDRPRRQRPARQKSQRLSLTLANSALSAWAFVAMLGRQCLERELQ